jgi:hypothetical protein
MLAAISGYGCAVLVLNLFQLQLAAAAIVAVAALHVQMCHLPGTAHAAAAAVAAVHALKVCVAASEAVRASMVIGQ